MTFLKTCLAFTDAEGASGKQAEAAAALPPVGSHTLVTDTLASPGHFVLYHFFAAAVTAKAKVSAGESEQAPQACAKEMTVVDRADSMG